MVSSQSKTAPQWSASARLYRALSWIKNHWCVHETLWNKGAENVVSSEIFLYFAGHIGIFLLCNQPQQQSPLRGSLRPGTELLGLMVTKQHYHSIYFMLDPRSVPCRYIFSVGQLRLIPGSLKPWNIPWMTTKRKNWIESDHRVPSPNKCKGDRKEIIKK